MELQARAGYRSQITKIINEATEFLKSSKVRDTDDLSKLDSMEEDLASYLQRLTTANENLRAINNDVQAKNIEDSKPEKVAEYDDSAVASKTHHTKLPKLELKKFSGDHQEWIRFWENFRTTVHENESLSGAEKFNYLQSVLTGNAAKTISGFTPSDTCYDGAISLLQEEYGDTEKLIDKLMQQLMALPAVSGKTDATGLRNLYNTVIACSRSLTALGVPSSHYYIMLKTILLKCMPNELRIDYHRIQKECTIKGEEANDSVSDSGSTLSFDGDKQVKNILKFLKQEVESIERAGVNKSSTRASAHHTQPSTAAGLFTPTQPNVPCLFCKSMEHSTKECNCTRTIDEKKQMLKDDGRCFRCTMKGHTARSCKVRSLYCKKCKHKHPTSLCNFNNKASSCSEVSKSKENSTSVAMLNPTLNLSVPNNSTKNDVFLQTARALLAANHSLAATNSLFVRLIIDGGSQRTYVREAIANKLNLQVTGFVNLSIIPFGQDKVYGGKKMKIVNIYLRSQFSDRSVEVAAVVVPEICLDVLVAPASKATPLDGFCLADSNFSGLEQEGGLSVLIGADYYWKVVTGKYKRITNLLTAVDTIFGWTLQGPCDTEKYSTEIVSTLFSCSLEDMWNLESLGIRSDEVEMKEFTKELQSKCIRKTETRYEALLPWKTTNGQLGNNKAMALSRLHSLLRRLRMDPSKLREYDTAMQQFITSGYAERVDSNDDNVDNLYFMPHCAVYRPEKTTTKIRIVFDASSHLPGKLSLNECLWTGSNLLPDILQILLMFRVGQIGLVADVEKAFLQIVLAKKDRDSHRFVWFPQNKDLSTDFSSEAEYRMTRVTFGVSSSPFLLSATIAFHIRTQAKEFPETCELLSKSFYMDDLVSSVSSQAEAEKFYEESTEVFKRAYMNLRKWRCNNSEIQNSLEVTEDLVHSVLGVLWNMHSDELMFKFDLDSLKSMASPTKRNLLKVIARVFDPLGFLSPILIKFKILFQSLWRKKVDWDERLDAESSQIYIACSKDLEQIPDISMPRWLGISVELTCIELHVFADASQKAFGAVAFLRLQKPNLETDVKFVCAKARVAPLKETKTDHLTLPKLELTAALVAARLCKNLKKLQVPFRRVYLWTDSQITLHWIQGDSRKWKPYVFSRVKEIHELTDVTEWQHCSGKENPADLVTRGISADKLSSSSLWKEGPSWLKEERCHWPKGNVLQADDCIAMLLPVFQKEVANAPSKHSEQLLLYETIGDWKKLLRITAQIHRGVNVLLNKWYPNWAQKRGRRIHTARFLQAAEMKKAETYWISFFQNTYFSNEIVSLQEGKTISRSSTLLTLNPFLDDQGLLRVGSRLTQLDEPLDVISPVILPRGCYLSKLIVTYFHECCLHSGVNTVLTRLRERFWLPAARQFIKKAIASCNLCRRLRGKAASQPFAPLPRDRFQASRPFETVGVDFAGPLYTRSDDNKTKVYIMIFTCAVVRAIHLELVLNLTTECCLLAIRRFIARRGMPLTIYSDNAKTFKKAATDVKSLGEIFNSEILNGFLSNRGINWKFSVERAPWWGGFWERLVKSVKDVLKVTIWKAKINNEELYTLLTEAERIINLRPLTYLSDDPMDLAPLTPECFLINCSKVTDNESKGETIGSDLQSKWKSRLQYTSFLWKRWKAEYLKLLRSAHHSMHIFSREIQLGDVVLVYDTSTPRIHWKLAVVEVCYPGRDNKIRSCEVRFADGRRFRRAIQLLYPLEMHQQAHPEDVEN